MLTNGVQLDLTPQRSAINGDRSQPVEHSVDVEPATARLAHPAPERDHVQVEQGHLPRAVVRRRAAVLTQPVDAVIDELWAHANGELYYALTTGQLARESPLVVSITTAGVRSLVDLL